MSKVNLELLTYAQIVDFIRDFADGHMTSLEPEQQYELIKMGRDMAPLFNPLQITPVMLIAFMLSVAVEMMALTPEYKTTKGKTALQVAAEQEIPIPFESCPKETIH